MNERQIHIKKNVSCFKRLVGIQILECSQFRIICNEFCTSGQENELQIFVIFSEKVLRFSVFKLVSHARYQLQEV